MATTYGYGGEFSSDEDIDKMEKQSERFVQSKFDSQQLKPTRHQIEEAIEAIKLMPIEQDFSITDELLAGLLEHYKTQRGPIVDSTRGLYKKIILRLIRGEQPATNGDSSKEINGSSNNNLNNINNLNLVNKKRIDEIQQASSDEDEPMPLIEFASKSNRILEPMDVDSEAAIDQQNMRSTKAVDISSTDSDSQTEESNDDENSNSEVLDVTPIKPTLLTPQPAASEKKQSDKKPTNQVKEIQETSASKPYTRRSQRVAATRAAWSERKETKTDVSSKKLNQVVGGGDLLLKRPKSSFVSKLKYMIPAIIMVALAYFFAPLIVAYTKKNF